MGEEAAEPPCPLGQLASALWLGVLCSEVGVTGLPGHSFRYLLISRWSALYDHDTAEFFLKLSFDIQIWTWWRNQITKILCEIWPTWIFSCIWYTKYSWNFMYFLKNQNRLLYSKSATLKIGTGFHSELALILILKQFLIEHSGKQIGSLIFLVPWQLPYIKSVENRRSYGAIHCYKSNNHCHRHRHNHDCPHHISA